jgi:hypothetical protein
VGAVLSALLTFASAGAARATPLKLPNFPLSADGAVKESIALADLNGDKAPEIVLASGTKLLAFSNDGQPVAHFPVDLAALTKQPDVTVVGAPAAGDLDGDGKPEICVAVSFGEDAPGALIAVHADGKPVWTTPVALAKGPGAGCTIGVVNGHAAVLVGTRGGMLHAVSAKGTPLVGFPRNLKSPLSSTVSIGRFAPSSKPVLAVGAADGKVFVVDGSGKEVDGFPLETAYEVSGAPAFADLDDDGENELIVASQDFKVYAVKADGSSLANFPVTTGFRIYSGAAIGDLLRDGHLDVVVASGDGKIHAWNGKGRELKGFPVTAGRSHAGVVVGDSTRTGKDDIFTVSSEGRIYGFDGTGHALDGFPVRLDVETNATPVLGDVDLDPAIELVVGDGNGKIHGYKLDRSGDLPQTPLSWPAPGHDSSRQGRFGPNVARYANLEAAPKVAHAGEAIDLSYKFWNLDGLSEPATRIRWTLNGQPAPDLDQKKQVPGARVLKGQKWRASIQSPEDFALYKDGPLATILHSAEVAVADTPPTAAKVTIEPNPARTTDTLTAKVLAASTDVDGDPVAYHYLWQRNGKLGPTQQTVAPGMAHRGEHWRVLITPNDGEKDGPTTDADLVIENTPPGVAEFTLGPASPTTETDIQVTITKDATDADGDKLSYRYQFYVNGQPQALAADRPFLPKGIAHKGDTVKAEVWAFDGEAEGPKAAAQIQIVDAAPEAPKVAITPEHPRTGDTLSSGLLAGARDPDHDPVTYRVSWMRNGQPAEAPGLTSVPGPDVHKGDTWAVSYVPSDGSLEGPAGTTQVTVVNSSPTRPRLTVSDTAPAATDNVSVFLAEPSHDVDADAIHYEYKWTVTEPSGEKPAKALAPRADRTTLAPGEFHKHQRILVEVTAIDVDGARSPVASAEIVPRNTPPTAPSVGLSPKVATTETGLSAVITTPATDADGDTLTYHYRWFRDGVFAADIGDRAALKPGEVKRGEQWRVVVRANDGEVDGPPIESVGDISNVPPVAPTLVMTPAHPTTVTGLTCAITTPARDADGDPITLHYTWFRNGVVFAMHEGAATIPPGVIRRGETWRCDVTARDDVSSSPVASASAGVVNAAPLPPTVAVEPKAARAGDALTCAITSPGTDPDGDRVEYEFHWSAPKGVKIPRLEDPARVPAGIVKKGQVWSCTVTANDGQAAADPIASRLAIGNTPPGAPELAVEPWGATPGQDLTCNIVKSATDVDGDEISYAYAWSRNGKVQSFAATSSGVPGRLVKAGDRWTCSATPNDGQDEGPAGSSAEMIVAQGADDE